MNFNHFQVAVQKVETDLEQKHMVNWIQKKVQETITPETVSYVCFIINFIRYFRVGGLAQLQHLRVAVLKLMSSFLVLFEKFYRLQC